jgi:hypothetical protein
MRHAFLPMAALVLGGLAPGRASAQSLLAAEGLGILSEPLDARARSLGSGGVGLPGWYLSDADPAASAGLSVPSAMATFQPATATLSGGENAGHTRFPAVAASYGYLGNVFSVYFGSFLDQEWEILTNRTIDLGSGEEVQAEDRFRSTGSVGRVRFGWSRTFYQSISVGLTVGRHLGTVERRFTRLLDSEDVGAGVEVFGRLVRLRASGAVAGGGVAWDPSPLLRVAGSVSWSGDLVLTPTSDSLLDERQYRLPIEMKAGATFALAPDLALHLGGTYADWTETGEDLESGSSVGGTWSYGGGLEWGGSTLLGRPVPIRVGARQLDLPFRVDGEAATERAFSIGAGVNLVDFEAQPLARMELGIDRGSREGGSLAEDFWRVALTVRVASG